MGVEEDTSIVLLFKPCSLCLCGRCAGPAWLLPRRGIVSLLVVLRAPRLPRHLLVLPSALRLLVITIAVLVTRRAAWGVRGWFGVGWGGDAVSQRSRPHSWYCQGRQEVVGVSAQGKLVYADVLFSGVASGSASGLISPVLGLGILYVC